MKHLIQLVSSANNLNEEEAKRLLDETSQEFVDGFYDEEESLLGLGVDLDYVMEFASYALYNFTPRDKKKEEIISKVCEMIGVDKKDKDVRSSVKFLCWKSFDKFERDIYKELPMDDIYKLCKQLGRCWFED